MSAFDDRPTPKLQCSVCDTDFSSLSGLSLHMERVHSEKSIQKAVEYSVEKYGETYKKLEKND